MPGFARVDEVASVLNELGTVSAFEVGADDANRPIINVSEIIFRSSNLD